MKAIVFLSLILLAACGQRPPHSKAEYNLEINKLVKESYDTLTFLIQHNQPTFLVKTKFDNQIDSLTQERDRWYK